MYIGFGFRLSAECVVASTTAHQSRNVATFFSLSPLFKKIRIINLKTEPRKKKKKQNNRKQATSTRRKVCSQFGCGSLSFHVRGFYRTRVLCNIVSCRCGRYCRRRRRRCFCCWRLRWWWKRPRNHLSNRCVVVLWWWCTGAGRHPIILIKITIFYCTRERKKPKRFLALCEIFCDSHSPKSSVNRNIAESQFIEWRVAFHVLSHFIFSFNFQTIYSRIISAMHLWKYLFSIWVWRWNRDSPLERWTN